jgi:hypothetical protein
MDVAVSSGVSTAEWAEDLAARGISFEILGTDKLISAELISVFRGFEVLATGHGDILHMDVAGYGLSPAKELRRRAHLYPIKATLRLAFAMLNSPRLAREPVRLVSRRVPREVSLEEDDLQAADPRYVRSFDVVRAANILNLAYFSRPVLRVLAHTLKDRLRDRGLLIVSRTRGVENQATIFEVAKDRDAKPLARLRNGSEVEDLVLTA